MKFKKCKEKCLLCQQHLLQDSEDYWGAFKACPQPITLPNGKVLKSHLYYYGQEKFIILLPYKVAIYKGETKILVFNKRAKPDSVAQFKTIAKLPTFKFTSSEQLLNKLKLINIFS